MKYYTVDSESYHNYNIICRCPTSNFSCTLYVGTLPIPRMCFVTILNSFSHWIYYAPKLLTHSVYSIHHVFYYTHII